MFMFINIIMFEMLEMPFIMEKHRSTFPDSGRILYNMVLRIENFWSSET